MTPRERVKLQTDRNAGSGLNQGRRYREAANAALCTTVPSDLGPRPAVRNMRTMLRGKRRRRPKIHTAEVSVKLQAQTLILTAVMLMRWEKKYLMLAW